MRKLIFLGSSTDLDALEDKEAFIIPVQLSDELELQRRGFNSKLFQKHAQSGHVWNDIVKHSRKWLLDNKHAYADFNFENIPLWDLVYDEIFEVPGGVFESLYLIKTISSLIQELNPEKIETRGFFEWDIDMVLNLLSKKYQFELISNSKVLKNKKKFFRNLGSVILSLERFVIGKISLFFMAKQNCINFILTHGFYAKKLGPSIISDLYLDDLHDYFVKSGKNPLVISLNLPRLHKSLFLDIWYDFWHILLGHYRPFIVYYSRKEFVMKRKLLARFYEIVKTKAEKNEFDVLVDDISLSPLIKKKALEYLPRRLCDAVLLMKMSERYLRMESPSKIINVEGFNLFGKALALECNRSGVEIFIPQLGMISKELPLNASFCLYTNFNKKLIPIFMIWGSFYRQIITQRGFPESKIFEVGFWRHNENKQATDSPNIFGKYLLYIAGANFHLGHYILSLDEELTTIKEIAKVIPSDMKMLLKLHPTHPYNVYEANLRGLNITIIKNEQKYNMKDLIANSVYVVGKCSTVLLQSLLLGKKVISVNFCSDIDFCGFKDSGSIFVNSIDSFKKVIENLPNSISQNFMLDQYCTYVGSVSMNKILQRLANNE